MGSEEIDGGRRRILKLAGIGGAASAAMAAVPVVTDAVETPDEQLKSRYRLNEHVERYYFLNRL